MDSSGYTVTVSLYVPDLNGIRLGCGVGSGLGVISGVSVGAGLSVSVGTGVFSGLGLSDGAGVLVEPAFLTAFSSAFI